MTLLDMRSVVRTYVGPPEVNALHNVDLAIDSGEYCAITGPSGSGKSTLFNVLGLLDQPNAGIYQVAGQNAMP